MELLNDHAADPVSSVLADIEVRSNVYCLSELGAPWGFRVEGRNVAKFHLVLAGDAVLEIDGDEPVPLACGELALLPHGHAHTIRDHPESPVERLDEVLLDHPVDDRARMTYGGDGAETRLLCGGFGLDALPELLRPLLPTIVRVDAGSPGTSAWLGAVFALLRQESTHPRPGARAVFAKLADVFLTQALRGFLIGLEDSGLLDLAPLADDQIATAVTLIHEDPTAEWSVAGLASAVGLSRSAFTERFRLTVGQTPMRYVTSTRLSRAAGYLATTDMNIFSIARACGYDSDESLSKAFKRTFEITPGQYRSRASEHPLLNAAPTPTT